METKPNSRTKQIVLARAHAIHYFAPLFTRGSAAFLALVAALYFIGREVWVARVFENVPVQSGFLAVARFFELAFLDTRFVVQALTLAVLFAAVWFAREAVRIFAELPARRYAY